MLDNSYYITTDATADFPKCLSEDRFEIVNMSYVLDGTLYDGVDTPFLSAKEFYAALASGKFSSTSLVTVEQAKQFFERILKQGHDIIHISFASILSGSYSCYVEAAAQLKEVYPNRKIAIIDSKCASGGEGVLVYYALLHRAQDAPYYDEVEYVTSMRDHIGHVFTVDDMLHLYRGGRVSRTAAVVGQAVQLKPVLMVSETGELVVTNKVMGRRAALKCMLDKAFARTQNFDNKIIVIGNADAVADAEWLKGRIVEKLNIAPEKVLISDIGPVIGSHLGKGGLTLFYLTENKKTGVK